VEQSKKINISLAALVAIAAIAGLGRWIYIKDYRSLDEGVWRHGLLGDISKEVERCIKYTKIFQCDRVKWNPAWAKQKEWTNAEIRYKLATIGYQVSHMNGTSYSEMDFSPSGQRKAERFANETYGDQWRGNNNNIAVNPKAMPGSPGANRNFSDGYQPDGQNKNKSFLGIDFSKTEQRRYGNIYNIEWGSPRHDNARENRRDVLRECNNVVRNKGLIPISGEELNAMLDAGAKIITGTDLKIRVSAYFYDEDGTVNRLMTDNENYIPGTCSVNETVIEGKASILK
tara:strand:+ start:227 stop:1084 length:858 start_codon:yes stop_codon:yes gene_type:complete